MTQQLDFTEPDPRWLTAEKRRKMGAAAAFVDPPEAALLLVRHAEMADEIIAAQAATIEDLRADRRARMGR